MKTREELEEEEIESLNKTLKGVTQYASSRIAGLLTEIHVLSDENAKMAKYIESIGISVEDVIFFGGDLGDR